MADTPQASAWNRLWGTEMSEGAGELIGEGVRFERIRRITGYLVGTTDRFNNAKRAEERVRVKHTVPLCGDEKHGRR